MDAKFPANLFQFSSGESPPITVPRVNLFSSSRFRSETHQLAAIRLIGRQEIANLRDSTSESDHKRV